MDVQLLARDAVLVSHDRRSFRRGGGGFCLYHLPCGFFSRNEAAPAVSGRGCLCSSVGWGSEIPVMPHPVLVVERVARVLTLCAVLTGEAGEVAPQTGEADAEIVLANREAEERGEPELVRAGEHRFVSRDLLLTQCDDISTAAEIGHGKLGEHCTVMSDALANFRVLGGDGGGEADPKRLDELGDHGNLRSGGVVDSAFKTFHGDYFQERAFFAF